MLKISISNSFSTLKTTNQGLVHQIVYDLLSYQIRNYEIIAKKKGWNNWKGIKSFYTKTDSDTGVFMTGLLPDVMEELDKQKIPFSVVDYRANPVPMVSVPKKITMADPEKKSIELYDYEIKCLEDFFKTGRGIIKAGTGAGKTEIAIAAFNLLQVPTLWITHRVNLMTQTAQRFEKRIPELKSKIGFFGGGEDSPNFITFSTVQTLHNAMKRNPQETIDRLKGFKFLIVDEAHRMKSKQFFAATCHCTEAYYRLALTATPFMRDDPFENLMLKGTVGDIVSTVGIEFLVDNGFIARPFFKFINVNSPKLSDKIRGRDIYKFGIVCNEVRNKIIVNAAAALKSMGKKTLIICQELDHCKNIKDLSDSTGLGFQLLTGKDSYEHRGSQLGKLADGSIDGIICTNILDEGIDIKEVSAIINAVGQQSAPPIFQRTGRAARKKETDNYCIVVDFIDRQHPGLFGHSMKRYSHVKSQPGFKILNEVRL